MVERARSGTIDGSATLNDPVDAGLGFEELFCCRPGESHNAMNSPIRSKTDLARGGFLLLERLHKHLAVLFSRLFHLSCDEVKS